MKTIVLRFGEINLKGKNRSYFEKCLTNNLKQKIAGENLKISYQRNRIFLDVEDKDSQKILNKMLKLPGIENISLADKCITDYEDIKKKVLEVFDRETPNFRVTTKRSYKKFEYTSQELSKKIGAEILKANDGLENMKVQMKNADQEITIEVSEKFSYVFHKKIKGMGGLPIGSGGRGLVLLSGGIDSPVAAIEAMKRGVKIDCVHFSTPPYTTAESLNKVSNLVEILREYDSTIKLYNVPFTDMQLTIKENCFDKFSLLLMRRMMYRKVSEFAIDNNYQMIITGESIGQVASQTIESITMTNMVSSVPVIRPVITFNKLEIINLAIKYGTYDISILPFEDACTVFAPKKPVTKPEIESVLKEEAKLDYEHILKNIEIIELEKEDELEKYLY